MTAMFSYIIIFGWTLYATRIAATEDVPIRLVGGSTDGEGRVEVLHDGQWGTVCDDGWDSNDARVVCRQLGFPEGNAAIAVHDARFAQGTRPIWLTYVNCSGSESNITSCTHHGWGNTSCWHTNDAGVICHIGPTDEMVTSKQTTERKSTMGHQVTPTHEPSSIKGTITYMSTTSTTTQGKPSTDSKVSLRLVGGENYAGRVEVMINGEWGTVCDAGWGDNDARVVCRQLGFPEGNHLATGNAYFGEGTGPSVLKNVNCVGSENNIGKCPITILGNVCSHSRDAGVFCNQASEMPLRLAGGTNSTGRVEVFFGGQWGRVCNDGWDNADAQVVCRQLGFHEGNHQAIRGTEFGEGTGPIVLTNVYCTASEDNIGHCPLIYLRKACGQYSEAAVLCNTASKMSVRLIGGTNQTGRVEVLVDGQWGTVCGYNWDNRDAEVVCRQLGFSEGNHLALRNAYFGKGTGPIVLRSVSCKGSESNIAICPSDVDRSFLCEHKHDAGVLCNHVSAIPVRLVGGTNQTGRVEVLLDGQWGSVCNTGWDKREAAVVCRQLGFPEGNHVAISQRYFGEGTGSVVLQNVDCVGLESSIANCPIQYWGSACRHKLDASVLCKELATEVSLRLVGGTNSTGRVEVFFGGQWGTVCHDGWDNNDAQVVCRQMGFSEGNHIATRNAYFGGGTGLIVLQNVKCAGFEDNIGNCSFKYSRPCSHIKDAGVVCNQASDISMRLIGGTNQTGRVEVFFAGQWGTVCDFGWDNRDAEVVCRQLGFPEGNHLAMRSAYFGEGIGPVVLQNTQCVGNESSIVNCYNNFWGSRCGHDKDAGVLCNQASEFPVRLIGETNQTGRVEVFLDGQWGTVCHSDWDNRDAEVVCRQLGFPEGNHLAIRNVDLENGTAPVILRNVNCLGNESSIANCAIDYWGNTCENNRDAGVVCNHASEIPVRLIGGTNQTGRVEVFFAGEWGTVCDSSWGKRDAEVVCRQLGFPEGKHLVKKGAYFGRGTGPVLLQNVNCVGFEASIGSCSFDFIGSTCEHDRDASVLCNQGQL